MSPAVDGVGQSLGPLLREEAAEEVGAVRRHLEERLVHQLRVQIAPPHVGDEHHLRPERDDVVEVLLGADAEVHAAGLAPAGEAAAGSPGSTTRSTAGCRIGSSRWARTDPARAARTPRRSDAPAACRRPPGRARPASAMTRLAASARVATTGTRGRAIGSGASVSPQVGT